MKAKVKTIDVQAKEWLDYFSARITVNFSLKSEQRFVIPFTRGHNDQYLTETAHLLQKHGILPSFDMALTRYCRENGIILRTNKQTGCKKQNVVSFVE